MLRPPKAPEPVDAASPFKLNRVLEPVRQSAPANGVQLADAPQEPANAQRHFKRDHQHKPLRVNRSSPYPKASRSKQTPQQLSKHIKVQWQSAGKAAARRDIDHVTAYFAHMGQLCQETGNNLDHMHITAILHGTAKVWLTAMDSRPQEALQQQLRQRLLGFLSKAVARLMLVLPEIDARGVSSMFWSFAKMQISPDILMPAAADGLAQQFIGDIEAATDQSHATLLLACVHLKVNPCKGELLQAIQQQLHSMDMTQFSSRHIANIVYSLAKLPRAQPTAQLIDNLCKGFLWQLQLPNAHRQPNGQDVANFAWALSELRHVPVDSLVSAMISRMLSLCCGFDQQHPSAQGTSNFLYGLANLRLPVRQPDAITLTMHLLKTGSQHRQNNQHLSNTAWSLAALRCLGTQTFWELLQAMQRPVEHNHLRQLYRALNWLRPHGTRDPVHQEAWSQLQAELHSIGPPPPMERPPLLGSKALAALLGGLGVRHNLAVPIMGCWVDAVVQPRSDWARRALIVFEVDTRCANAPSRLTGCAAVRYELLAREGALILIPPSLAQATLEQLERYVKPRLAFAAAGSLDVYLK